ncbi:LAMI_0G07206g1_1 [Lachancea mirantina]|uniref:LAMI_0G07206g1_1 n=1 Tax=Lachancea mirantina TaxID=1230905 RepID=A0A1G4K9G8_9SACH|nr:LAMI_0G07206g1_1 [Lachancea mirantina]
MKNSTDTNLPPPPAYQEAPAAAYEQTEASRNFIPDDFKFSTAVASCEPQIRRWFMRKVYTLLSCQLVASFSMCLLVARSERLQRFVASHQWIMILAIVGALVTCVWLAMAPRQEEPDDAADPASAALMGVPSDTRSAPWYCLTYRGQLALLAVFTACEAYSLSLVTLVYDPQTVLRALLVTVVVVVGISLVAMSERFELATSSLTNVYYWLNLALWLLIGIGISSIFFGMGSAVDLFYSWGGATLFTVYLFVDTQLIFRKVYPDEEVRCAMVLYVDIINLFLYILRIMSRNRDD